MPPARRVVTERRTAGVDRAVFVPVEIAAAAHASGVGGVRHDDALRLVEYPIHGTAQRRVGAVGGEVGAGVDQLRRIGRSVAQCVVPEIRVVRVNRVALRKLEPQHDVAAAVAAIDAEQCRRPRLVTRTVLHGAGLNVEVEALEVSLEDEVDDARDGVRAVHRRRAARDHFHALDRRGWNRVDVHSHRRVDRYGSIAVDQNEISIGAESSQAHRRRARGQRREVVRHLALILQLRHALRGGNELRQLVQRRFEPDRVLLLEGAAIERL